MTRMTQPPAMDGEGRARPSDQALVASDEAGSRLHPSGFDPSRVWHYANGERPDLREDEVIYALGRYGDIYGPLPFEMFADAAWAGTMLHASHDLNAYCFFDGSWRQAFAYDAIATEARRAETLGSVHEGAGPKDIAHD